MLVGRVVTLCGAKRRDLDCFRAGVDVHEPEPAADDERAPEQWLHLLGPRIGRDVEILRLDAEQQIAHGAADDVRLESRVLQSARHVERAARELCAAQRMIGRTVDTLLARATVPAWDQAGEKASDH